MNLSDENVLSTVRSCLYDGDVKVAPSDAILVTGIRAQFGFNPEKVAQNRENINSMLEQLPNEFKSKGGGGWSFLNMCVDYTGRQWTDYHMRMDELICLGLAAGLVQFCTPREFWEDLPGGVPYLVVDVAVLSK